MTSHVLFIADLHLSSAHPRVTQAFLDFLARIAPQAEALYILGDLFEAWAGDDDLDAPLNRMVADALAACGTAVHLMHGNRDFLMGEAMARACGARLLSEPFLLDLYGTPTLLLHGDVLCSDDVAYFAFRNQVRDPAWQAGFLAKPLAERKQAIATWLAQSREAKMEKRPEIMDVNPQTVAETLRVHGYPRLIHGHTHRPAQHLHEIDGHACERWVLPDWNARGGGYLRCDAEGCRAIAIEGEQS